MLKNKTILMVIVVAILVVTGFIGTRFVFKKFNVPSILPFSTTQSHVSFVKGSLPARTNNDFQY